MDNLKRSTGVDNEHYRNTWIEESLSRIVQYIPSNSSLIDVGAGLSPYKKKVQELKMEYISHDFNSYIPDKNSIGLQDTGWNYPTHEIICEILDIPEIKKYEVVLCTEVLEHVPDPVRALKKLSSLVSSPGYVLVSVPFLSLMHQAPYWYSSGLSPYWFDYWAKEYDLEIIELEVSGDYIDLMKQEAARLLDFKYFPKILRFIIPKIIEVFRHLIPNSVIESGGFNTLCLLRKK